MREPSKKELELAKRLTARQKQFVLNYLETGNISQSAIDAGYKPSGAPVVGSVTLKKPYVAEYVKEVKKRLEDEKIADITEVYQYLTGVMRGEINDQFDLEPALSDRTKAAQELLKRLEDKLPNNNPITIINNIPLPNEK